MSLSCSRPPAKLASHWEASMLQSERAEPEYNARTTAHTLQVKVDGEWQDFFIHGINLGPAQPGHGFTALPADFATYQRWLQAMAAMHVNVVRIYTLLDPLFYAALKAHNETHAAQRIMLLQEVWVDEGPANDDFLGDEANRIFHQDMRNIVDAVHGHAAIAPRPGHASGAYLADVSPYVLGYLVGRELLPPEVMSTNARHPHAVFQGDYAVAKTGASPTEVWLASGLDYIEQYEESSYGWQHPVAIVSWPTLDPLQHETEWGPVGSEPPYNDAVAVDLNAHFDAGPRLRAGLFGAYHIYPNYPDFMNEEPRYADYQDAAGVLRYGGYLREFMRGHQRYPAIVAEFGLPTGLGNAHTNPEGLNQGGLSEEAQGVGLVRMYDAIKREGCAGAVVFEWMDEWAKKTWLTERYMIPFERHIYWHNLIDPEQNYGVVANDAARPRTQTLDIAGSGLVDRLSVHSDEAFLTLELHATRPWNLAQDRLELGLDTFDRSLGADAFPSGVAAPSGLKFVVQFNGPVEAKLLVVTDYNIAAGRRAPTARPRAGFEELHRETTPARRNKAGAVVPAQYEDGSTLHYGDFATTYHTWYIEGSTLHVRLPWGRLNFTDPSQRMVLNEPRPSKPFVDLVASFQAQHAIAAAHVLPQLHSDHEPYRVQASDGIIATAVLTAKSSGQVLALIPGKDALTLPPSYLWDDWTQPFFAERTKHSYDALRLAFGRDHE